MSNFGVIQGQFIDLASGGTTFVNSPLGTMTSVVQLNRTAPAAGPVPVDLGNNYFQLDLTSYSGIEISVYVYSDKPNAYQFHYADAFPDPIPIENLTDFGDALRGARCQRTGLWVPASRVKWVKGIPFYDIVAPDLISEILPNPPGILQPSSYTDNTPTTGPYDNHNS